MPRSTLRQWVKDGLVHLEADGAYLLRHVIEALLVQAIRGQVNANVARNVVRRMRVDGTLDLAVTIAIEQLSSLERFDIVIDHGTKAATICFDDAALITAVSDVSEQRHVTVVPLARRLARALDSFENQVETTPVPAAPRPGRVPAPRSATVSPIRGEA